MAKHFSEVVIEALVAGGWRHQVGACHHFDKVIVGWAAPGGVMVPDGSRRVYLQIDPSGRWFERVDGWGAVEECVDLREFDKAADAIAAVLERK